MDSVLRRTAERLRKLDVVARPRLIVVHSDDLIALMEEAEKAEERILAVEEECDMLMECIGTLGAHRNTANADRKAEPKP